MRRNDANSNILPRHTTSNDAKPARTMPTQLIVFICFVMSPPHRLIVMSFLIVLIDGCHRFSFWVGGAQTTLLVQHSLASGCKWWRKIVFLHTLPRHRTLVDCLIRFSSGHRRQRFRHLAPHSTTRRHLADARVGGSATKEVAAQRHTTPPVTMSSNATRRLR